MSVDRDLKLILDQIVHVDPLAENLDDLPASMFLAHDGNSLQRADYFLMQRSIIVEVKSLSGNRGSQLNEWLNRKAESDPWLRKFWFGTVDVEQIFCRHPDGERLKRESLDFFYRSVIGNCINSARPQLRSMKNLFLLPGASCGVIIINARDLSIEISDLTIAIRENLGKRELNGDRTCQPIDFVLIISETELDIQNRVSHWNLIVHPDAKEIELIQWYFKNDLFLRWASHRGLPTVFRG
ncbi:hypothetical protein [Achromobacter sp. RTa]|uniref:hypothetical protein n=1 Tax=Achromobacter sp. RTa TaxID=1532557 RepID=UPI0012DFFD47|nr:hypothetical protein [Achromobacter sp. RTa]